MVSKYLPKGIVLTKIFSNYTESFLSLSCTHSHIIPPSRIQTQKPHNTQTNREATREREGRLYLFFFSIHPSTSHQHHPFFLLPLTCPFSQIQNNRYLLRFPLLSLSSCLTLTRWEMGKRWGNWWRWSWRWWRSVLIPRFLPLRCTYLTNSLLIIIFLVSLSSHLSLYLVIMCIIPYT